MLADQIGAVIHNCSLRDLDHIARKLWQAYGSGTISEPEAERLASALELRRGVRRAELPRGMAPVALSFVPRRPQRSPDRVRSQLRRRQLAAAGPLPPALACMFTTGELAALAVIGAEVRQQGTCDRSIDELAARAGVSRSTVQRAIRQACIAGLVTKEERPRRGQKSQTNILRVVSREWSAWLKRAGRQPGQPHRVSILKPHGQQQESQAVKKTGDSPIHRPLTAPEQRHEVCPM